MNGETWTEYAVRFEDGSTSAPDQSRADTQERLRMFEEWGHPGFIVGRTVTATDWLPVQDQS